jgi:hypothetical protein
MRQYFQIPLHPSHSQTLRVTLQGIEYTFKLAWNTISQIWILDIYDSVGTTPIIRGIPLVTGTDLLGQFTYLTVASTAVLMTLSIGPGISPDEPPTFTNLGIDGQLIYVSH